MISLILVISVSLVLSIDGQKLHEHLTEEEIQSVFNSNHDTIRKLDYEVVKIFHEENHRVSDKVHSRSNPVVRLQAFDQDYVLYLEENNGVLLGEKTKIFLADVDESEIVYTEMKYPLPEDLRLYHDITNRAAITVQKDSENRVHVDGVVGDNLIIRPLPARVHQEVLRNHEQAGSSSNSFYQPTHHVVYRPNQGQVDSNNGIRANHFPSANRPQENYQQLPVNGLPTSPYVHVRPPIHPPVTTRQPETWRPYVHARPPIHPIVTTQPPVTLRPVADGDTVYLQVLITLDYQTYKTHKKSNEAVAKYMAAFWNAVDLRYREISNPKIRLNIAGLIIPQNLEAVPYMNEHVVDGRARVAGKTMDEIESYFTNQTKFPKNTYDVVVALSNYTLGLYRGERFNDGVSGMANAGNACQTMNGKALALLWDEGGFKGITTAAHEIAHTLGVPHDGRESGPVPGGPCAWNDGYLMSYDRKDSRGLHWSQCSLTAMQKFLKSDKAQCLRNKPDVGKPYPKILPGRLLSRDEQCRRTMGLTSHEERENDCAILWCQRYYGTHVAAETLYRPPAEGSSCGEGAICLNGKCVKDPEASN